MARIRDHAVVRAALRTAQVVDVRDMLLECVSHTVTECVGHELLLLRLSANCNTDESPYPASHTLALFKSPLSFYQRATWQWRTAARRVVTRLDDGDFGLRDFDRDHEPPAPKDMLPQTLDNLAVIYPFRPALLRPDILDAIRPRWDGETEYANIVRAVQKHFSANSNHPNRTLTFVSPDEEPIDRLDIVARPLTEPSWAYIRAKFQDHAPHLLASLEFFTAQEYRARVGDEISNRHVYYHRRYIGPRTT